MSAPTVRDHLLARRGDRSPGLLAGDRTWTWDEVVAASAVRAAVVADLLAPDRPPHVGVLLDNVPEHLLLLGGAALGGYVVVGLNPTRRGPALAADVARSDCQVVVTDAAHLRLLDCLDYPDTPDTPDTPKVRVPVLLVDGDDWAGRLRRHHGASVPDADVRPDTLLMLIFTSGTSGEPKAVNVTHAKVAGPGVLLAERFGLTTDDVAYVAMPLFHSNAVMAGWAPALAAGAAVALAPRFSASGFLPDVRRYGATYANYVGKPLAHVLATPAAPDDADNPLRLVFGNEANERDIAAFGERFGCTVVDSYSSTENAVIVQRVPGMPPGSLGRPLPGVKVLDPVTTAETPDARFGPGGELLNADEATGELVNTTGAGAFAGYYRDPDAEAERMRGGMYWSGDLAYRDAEGFVYFAGRTSEWLRVDGENLGAATVERVLLRHPAVSEAAVYAVPDPSSGDMVVAALFTTAPLAPEELERFLDEQPDLSTKGRPRWVRLLDTLPRTATTKVLKGELAAEGVTGRGGTLWERDERGTAYREVLDRL
ncbi:AMP-binding protein [Nocardioides sp. SYSU D00038]|uniref:AMP-binding protein n=1 Tax=Nocardioides sp. SYSU D00038 TaxID=2812554 RepID=UPI0019686FA0|nr:AMP-binding protein [Nocardioides sp. SYSU D00038]